MPNPNVTTAPLPSIWNMIPRASYGANASATSQGNNASEQQQNQQAMLNELKGIRSALSRRTPVSRGNKQNHQEPETKLYGYAHYPEIPDNVPTPEEEAVPMDPFFYDMIGILAGLWAEYRLALAVREARPIVTQALNRYQTFYRQVMRWKEFKQRGMGYNPAKYRTPKETMEWLRNHPDIEIRGTGHPLEGQANFYNKRTGRSFRIDLKGKGDFPLEESHIDAHYRREFRTDRKRDGLKDKKKLWFE